MANISKITLPNGQSYDIKDTTARNTGKVSGVKGNVESSYRTGNVNITPANIGAYKVGTEVSHKNSNNISANPAYAELTTKKNALDYQALRAVAGIGDWFYAAHLNPNFNITSNYNGNHGAKGTFSISTLFDPPASSTVKFDVDTIAETPFVLTIEKVNGVITATDVAHLELWDHTLGDQAGRLTDYKVELLTTGSTSSSGTYTWQTVYERHNVQDKINGLSITLNPTTYSYIYFKGLRFTIEGATPNSTVSSNWGYNAISMSLFRLIDQRPAFSVARAMGALDLVGGEVFGPVKVDDTLTATTFSGSGALLTSLNGSNISTGTVAAARIANLDASKITTGTLSVNRGGTGQTTAQNAANAFINALDTNSTTPGDADYYVAQVVEGGTSNTNYNRKPISALWEYIKSKISSILGLTATTYGGSAATVNNHTVESDVPPNLGGTIVVAQTQPIDQNVGDIWLEISTT